MRLMSFALLVLLVIGALPANAADKIFIYENWETGFINPSVWSQGGIPLPQIVPGGHNSNRALNSNGDTICDSGIHTRSFFPTKNGLVAEFWLKPFMCMFCFYSTSRTGFTTKDLINSGQCSASENYYQGLAYVELDTSRSQIKYYIKSEGVILTEPYPDYDWHHFRIEISSSGIVSFYRDGLLRVTSSAQLDLNLYFGTKFQYWGQANFGPNLIDDIIVAEPETNNLIFDSEVEDYTVVSVNPPVQLPPQPLKGIVRITVKAQAFFDFDSEAALVISLSSLNERFKLGRGAIQLALPENISPQYEAIRTKWEYYNSNCGEVTLDIPQLNCENSEFYTDVFSRLFPSGSAAISSLGLESSIECSDSNTPYDGTLFIKYNTHDTVNYEWGDPATDNCASGDSFDGKEIEIIIPIEESIADALFAINTEMISLNVNFSVFDNSDGSIYKIDILADKVSP